MGYRICHIKNYTWLSKGREVTEEREKKDPEQQGQLSPKKALEKKTKKSFGGHLIRRDSGPAAREQVCR